MSSPQPTPPENRHPTVAKCIGACPEKGQFLSQKNQRDTSIRAKGRLMVTGTRIENGPTEDDGEGEHELQGDGSLGRRRKRAKAKIGPMTTTRKLDRIGRSTRTWQGSVSTQRRCSSAVSTSVVGFKDKGAQSSINNFVGRRQGGRKEDVSPGVTGINAIRRAFLEIVAEDQRAGLLVVILRPGMEVPAENAKNAHTRSEESGEEVVSGRKSVIRLGGVAFVDVCKVGYCGTLSRPKPAGSVAFQGGGGGRSTKSGTGYHWIQSIVISVRYLEDIKTAALSWFKAVFLGLRDQHTVFTKDMTGKRAALSGHVWTRRSLNSYASLIPTGYKRVYEQVRKPNLMRDDQLFVILLSCSLDISRSPLDLILGHFLMVDHPAHAGEWQTLVWDGRHRHSASRDTRFSNEIVVFPAVGRYLGLKKAQAISRYQALDEKSLIDEVIHTRKPWEMELVTYGDQWMKGM
ncbi:hypothetical protein ARMSODRAFT_983423 [Armillaria solidipes]|uniref:Uncharacterized protein n=1 Tax=Armillaria solidipes TaxID=1076256 RepID=A0A2H3AVP8_9AGAR|nr:hypothetical protein ARMSODRAFT_983423 [Armillaria solidipes]